MNVDVTSANGDLIWQRTPVGGLACQSYVQDGTQKRIISALQIALGQAEAEMQLFDVADVVPDVGAAAS